MFNLLPLPPLDGSKIVGAFLSPKMEMQYYKYQRFIIPIVFILLFSGVMTGPLNVVQDAFLNGILWLAQLPSGGLERCNRGTTFI